MKDSVKARKRRRLFGQQRRGCTLQDQSGILEFTGGDLSYSRSRSYSKHVIPGVVHEVRRTSTIVPLSITVTRRILRAASLPKSCASPMSRQTQTAISRFSFVYWKAKAVRFEEQGGTSERTRIFKACAACLMLNVAVPVRHKYPVGCNRIKL